MGEDLHTDQSKLKKRSLDKNGIKYQLPDYLIKLMRDPIAC